MYKADFVYDGGAFIKSMSERQKEARRIIGAETREQARRLIGRPVKFGNKARPKNNGVFRAWAQSDGENDAPARAIVNTEKNSQNKLTLGLIHKNAKGEKWLSSIEHGGKFNASPALVEYKANELANKYLKLRRFR